MSTTSKATGQVDSASFGRICFTPENTDRIELTGCWPISAADAAGLEQGDCIEARIPKDANDRVTDVRVLDRECQLRGPSEPSTGQAIQSVIWFACLGAAVVFFAVILPRLRRRRALARVQARRAALAPPSDPVEIGEPTEVTVIDVSELGRHRSND